MPATPRTPDFQDIERAAARIKDAIVATPCSYSRTLSRLCGADIYIKFENLQFTASFKERGALNTLLDLSEEQRQRGVIAMSAGNHAQGVAYHASRLGIPATIVMPRNTSFIKVRHTRDFGAEVILEGETVDEAFAHAARLQQERELTFIHPYDDARIIAGQGTIAIEMLRTWPDLDVLVVPVGGGGLIAGIQIGARHLKPDIRIIGVESELYPSLHQILASPPGSPDPGRCPGGTTVAEGIAVQTIGRLPLKILRDTLERVLLVSELRIEEAIGLLANVEKTVAEGAGAAALAAVLEYPEHFRGQRVGLVLCGGNIDSRLFAGVLLRQLVREGRIARLRVSISDTPGNLARVAALIADGGGNIISVTHQRLFAGVSVRQADLDLAIETRDAPHMQEIETRIRDAGFTVRRLDPADP